MTLLLFPVCTKPRARYQNSEPPNQRNNRDSRADRTAPISRRFLLPNITYILIIHSGSVARTVPIKNHDHGQDSSTSQLESIRFKYLRLKSHLKERRTCPKCKNRYGPVTGCNFSCNLQRYSTLGRCKIGKYTFPSQFANIFLTYQTFVTNLHLLRVELPLHRVTGPLAHHVVLNHTFELLISINKWNYKQM